MLLLNNKRNTNNNKYNYNFNFRSKKLHLRQIAHNLYNSGEGAASFTNLDLDSKKIIYESILTTFEVSFIFLWQQGMYQKL